MDPQRYDVSGTLDLHVRSKSADVHVRQTDTAQAVVHVTGERSPDEVTVQHAASPGGTRITVTQHKERWGFWSKELSIEIEVPEGTRADLSSGAGDVTTLGSLASASIRCGSGDIDVERVEGSARLRNASGDVRARALGDDVATTTASGDVELGETSGALEVRTASGDVSIGAVLGGARVVSASGDIAIAAAGSSVALRSVSGDIEVGVPAGSRVWFDLSSTSGDTRSDLVPDATTDHDERIEVVATSVSGDIAVHRAAAPRGSAA